MSFMTGALGTTGIKKSLLGLPVGDPITNKAVKGTSLDPDKEVEDAEKRAKKKASALLANGYTAYVPPSTSGESTTATKTLLGG